MIRNIILDVGKVLVEWEPEKAMQKLGFSEAVVEAVAKATVASADWNESDRALLDDAKQVAYFVEKAPEYEKEIRLFWDNIGLAISQYSYTKTWIQEMKAAGYHIYILSNYARWTYQHTKEQLSFLKDVDGALFSFEVHQIKPEPEIYQSLFEKFHLIPEECFFLDDRLENIEAAKSQGMDGMVFTDYEAVRKQMNLQNIIS